MNLQGRSLLTIKDYNATELYGLLERSARVKRERHEGRRTQRLAGYTLAMIFEKLSTRTRSAFETAFGEEGGHPVFLSTNDIHLGKKESLEDSARVLGGMFDIIAFRGFLQSTVEGLAKWSGIPVVNALTDDCHPTQILADLLTLQEEFHTLEGLRYCFVGDGTDNVARSLMEASAILGMHLVVVCPEEYRPLQAHIDELQPFCKASKGTITVTKDLKTGLKDAAAVYTDVWLSMGQEDTSGEKERVLKSYQVNDGLMALTGRKDSIFLHCLPAVKGKEVTYEVMEGPHSRVWIEAENRKHTIKAVILTLLGLS